MYKSERDMTIAAEESGNDKDVELDKRSLCSVSASRLRLSLRRRERNIDVYSWLLKLAIHGGIVYKEQLLDGVYW